MRRHLFMQHFNSAKYISENEIQCSLEIITCDPLNVYPTKKRNAPLRTVQLSGGSKVIGQFSLYKYKGTCMSGTAASHVICNLASKLC